MVTTDHDNVWELSRVFVADVRERHPLGTLTSVASAARSRVHADRATLVVGRDVIDALVDGAPEGVDVASGLRVVCAGPEVTWMLESAPSGVTLRFGGCTLIVRVGALGLVLTASRPIRPMPEDLPALRLYAELCATTCWLAVERAAAQAHVRALEDAHRQLAEQNVLLRGLVVVDELTGLYNRRYLDQRLAWEMERFERYRRPFSVLMVDLDHFKRINDTWGHPAGDAVLREAAVRLRDMLRRTDVAARVGGEEFAILLSETDELGAMGTAERLRRCLARAPVVVDGVSIPVTASFGVAFAGPGFQGDVGAILREADQRLYQAKRDGRDRVAGAGEAAALVPQRGQGRSL